MPLEVGRAELARAIAARAPGRRRDREYAPHANLSWTTVAAWTVGPPIKVGLSAERLVAPDGGEIIPISKPAARRHAGQGTRSGLALSEAAGLRVYSSVTEVAEAEGISKSYISRVLRLTLLASHIVEARSSSGERTIRSRWSGRCRRAGRSSSGSSW
jgi:hypothetical protein